MKKAFLKLWNEYFNFTKGERNAFFVLVIGIIALCIYPMLGLDVYKDHSTDFSAFTATAAMAFNDTAVENDPQGDFQDYPDRKYAVSKQRFHFNPNTATAKQFEQLGFKPYIAKRIEKYRVSGGKFRIRADLLKVYGIDQNLVNELWNEIDLPENFEKPAQQEWEKKETSAGKVKKMVELNTADTTELIQLPGIGSKLAKRIVDFRSKLGGFYSFEQLKEVYGLKPETIDLIMPRLYLNKAAIAYISINEADAPTLDMHPYINRNQAAAIVAYRKQHGAFRTMEDLQKLIVLDEATLDKIKNYIKF